jgi:outer membrane protein OmpA-like peptidoglycan-associated protein
MLGEYLKNNPDAYVIASGYADSFGDEDYNVALSKRRAASARAFLVDRVGIDADRIVDLWFGELNPTADNSTAQGRRLNRRVEISVGK